MTREIRLPNGVIALVDDEDYERVACYKWSLSGGYARRHYWENGKRRKNFMHRLILPSPPGLDVDHVDGNKLNNTRGNLRIATRGQNRANSRHVRGTSKFKGVRARYGNWAAEITVNGKKTWLGTFRHEIDAARAYDRAALAAWGKFAVLNAP